jgi:predicted nuclease of predicted toxin-antitoxin system
MDIRELKRPPILDDPDTYDALTAQAELLVSGTPLSARPHNVAILAALQVAETLVGRINARHLAEMVALATSGARPHSFPVYQGEVEAPLHALRPVLRAIDLAARPDQLPPVVGETELREAGVALFAGARVTSALSLIDEGVIGWRGFRVTDKVVELLHRSPAHMRRRIEGALNAEAAHNAPLMDGARSEDEERFYQMVNALQDGANRWDWTRDDALISGALLPARRAARQLHRWDDLDDVPVGADAFFTVGEFRRVAEVVHAIATVGDLIGDPIATLGASRVLRALRTEWLRVLAHHAQLDPEHVAAALEFMTRRAVDEPRGRTEGRAATTNPFFDVGGGELALSVLCTMWQDPVWSLLATWTRRAPADFGAKMSERGHRLAARVRDLFAARGWVVVLERDIPTSDLDIAAAVRADPFMIVVEAKAFTEDPVRQSEDPKVWTQLADNVDAVRDRDLFRQVFQAEKLQPGEIVGLVVVPEYMTPAGDLGPDFSAIGVEDLARLVADATSPRELWKRIKAAETEGDFPVTTERLEFGEWTLVFDIGDRAALPVAVRAKAASRN